MMRVFVNENYSSVDVLETVIRGQIVINNQKEKDV